MDTNTQQLINTNIQQLTDWIKSAGQFVAEQTPDFVNQYLAYSFFDAILGVVFALSVMGSLAFFVYKINRCKDLYNSDKHIIKFFLYLGIFATSLLLYYNIGQAAKVKIAPKVFIAERIVDMFKK